jgi:tRNA threonylcarbamoyl adenosine modification protein YeaZ
MKPTHQWVIDTTGFELLFGLKNTQTKEWLFRYETPLTSQRSHSTLLVPLFQEACSVANLSLSAITALTVCIGPGSFTGLRAGLATVKTLGQWLPTLAITPLTVFERLRLQAKLAGCFNEIAPLTVLLDAKQNRLYTATWLPETGWEPPQFIMKEAWLNLAEQSLSSTKKKPLVILNETLVPLCEPINCYCDCIEALTPYALEAISLAEQLPIAWQQLEPLYLQSPNITIKKTSVKDVY